MNAGIRYDAMERRYLRTFIYEKTRQTRQCQRWIKAVRHTVETPTHPRGCRIGRDWIAKQSWRVTPGAFPHHPSGQLSPSGRRFGQRHPSAELLEGHSLLHVVEEIQEEVQAKRGRSAP